jgi:hypothetical protein
MTVHSLLVIDSLKPCERCGSRAKVTVQFHHEGAWQKTHEIGSPLSRLPGTTPGVEAPYREFLGYPNPCASCGHDPEDMYTVEVASGIVVGCRIADEHDLKSLDW